jgi:hypothetical protein
VLDSVLVKRVQPKWRFPANASSLNRYNPGQRTPPRLEHLCRSLRDPVQFELCETKFNWTIEFKLPPMLAAPHSVGRPTTFISTIYRKLPSSCLQACLDLSHSDAALVVIGSARGSVRTRLYSLLLFCAIQWSISYNTCPFRDPGAACIILIAWTPCCVSGNFLLVRSTIMCQCSLMACIFYDGCLVSELKAQIHFTQIAG